MRIQRWPTSREHPARTPPLGAVLLLIEALDYHTPVARPGLIRHTGHCRLGLSHGLAFEAAVYNTSISQIELHALCASAGQIEVIFVRAAIICMSFYEEGQAAQLLIL